MKVTIEDIEEKIIDVEKSNDIVFYKERRMIKKMNMLLNRIGIKRIKAKRALVGLLVAALLFVQSPYFVIAQTTPTAPTPPPVPENTNETPEAPTAPETPETPIAPTLEEYLNPSPTPSPTPKPPKVKTDSTTPSTDNTSSETTEQGSGGNVGGDTDIITGDANNTANINNTDNTNISTIPLTSASVGTSGGVSVANTGNGTGSANTGSVGIVDNNNTTQNNTAVIGNNLTQTTITGDNDASRNTGGDSNITTGDANTTGTILNSINTNMAGIGVYEFNIVDDHLGDYVLDFSRDNCVSGCTSGDVAVANTGNGSDSENTASADLTDNNNTFQNNDAVLANNMVLESDSGGNTADKNTNGDSIIETGDANVSGNILNFVNNNFAGEVVYAVVNIFGNLIGDIILPDGTVVAYSSGGVSAENSGNGANSDNTAGVDQAVNNDIYQFNNVDIENNLVLSATTGDNETSKNTNGNSSIETGDSSLIAQVTNIANLNLLGGNYWLVIVNEAGRWIGKILGATDNAHYAGSEIFEFVVDEYGQIAVTNSGNGADSVNNAGVSQTTNNTVVQNNNASIVNNVNLSANTGDNSASKNAGGDSSIKTGDANVIANIVNFVNNNIVGTGKLFVTVVNVFGSWLGDFVGPGQSKALAEASDGRGGTENTGGRNISAVSDGGSNSGTSASLTDESSVSEPTVDPNMGVIGLFVNRKNTNSSSILGGEDSSDGQVAFAGATDGDSGSTAGDKVININLAWLVFLIPAASLFIFKKRMYVLLRALPIIKGNV